MSSGKDLHDVRDVGADFMLSGRIGMGEGYWLFDKTEWRYRSAFAVQEGSEHIRS
jgi:hypothetical protein